MRKLLSPNASPAMWMQLAGTIKSIGSDSFGSALLGLLGTQTSFDSALVLYYGRRRRPVILADHLLNSARTNAVDRYVAGAYLLDPFYIKSRIAEECCLMRMSEIAPDDFEQSEYYSQYYQDSKVVDEVNLFVPLEPGRVFAVSLERAHPSPSFSDADIAGLRACNTAVAALAQAHLPASGILRQGDEADREHDRLEDILRRFGASVLTPRELEVVQLILSGHSAPEVAQLLGVTLDTAKVHRRNIYGKLGVSSLAELFSLVLQTIMKPGDADGAGTQDAVQRMPA